MALAKLYTTRTPTTSADLLSHRVLPFATEQELPVLRILTDRGTEYRGKVEQHDYQLSLAMTEIVHYEYERSHQGKMCCGRTPMATFHEGKRIWQDKSIG